MKTLITILIFIITYGAFTRFIGITILNIVGLPGALIAFKSRNKSEFRYILGVITSSIGHVYIYLSFIVYEITWTRTRIDVNSYSKYLIWFFCMIATIGTIETIYHNAKKEYEETSESFLNPQIEALRITKIISFYCFFLFVLYPKSINPIWTWVTNIGFLF